METKNQENFQKALAEHAESFAAFETYAMGLKSKYKGNFSKELLTEEEKVEWARLEGIFDAAVKKVKLYEQE